MKTLERLTIAQKLTKLGACREAVDWVEAHEDQSPQELWDDCKDGSWMLWLCGKLSGPAESEGRKKLVKCACACARLALKYVKEGENRPRICIETAEAWTEGNATIEEVRKARAYAYAYACACADAADAADACADAAYAADAYAYSANAARSKMLARCADIVRKHYPTAPEL